MTPLTLLAVVLAAAPPQAAPPRDGPPPDAPLRDPGEWIPASGVAAVVDDELVTWPELNEYIARVRAQFAAETPEEIQALAVQLVPQVVSWELQARAGLEMDIPLEAIDATLEASLDDQLDDAGAVAFGESVRQRGGDPLRERVDQRKAWLQSLWVQRIQGRRSAIGQRPIADSFVRPGELRAAYVDQRAILGEPATVRMQILDLQAAAWGGMQYALEAAEEYRELFLSGEVEFSELVRNYGAKYRDTAGRIDWTPVDAIADPELRAFLERAEVGEVSQPLASGERSEPSGYQVVLVTDRQEGEPPPPFDAPGVQDELATRLLQSRRQRFLDRADARLRERAYVWVHPDLRGPEGR